MTFADGTFMAKNYHSRPRERLGWFLRQMYPGAGRDKRLASDLSDREFEITARAARNLFEDHWPGDETWAAIVRRFGDRVWRVVMAPEIEPVLAELAEEEARLVRDLERTRAHRREVQGLVEGRSFGVAGDPSEDPAQIGPPNLDLFEGRL